MKLRLAHWTLWPLAVVACGDDDAVTVPRDAGTTDAQTADVGTPDAGERDASAADDDAGASGDGGDRGDAATDRDAAVGPPIRGSVVLYHAGLFEDGDGGIAIRTANATFFDEAVYPDDFDPMLPLAALPTEGCSTVNPYTAITGPRGFGVDIGASVDIVAGDARLTLSRTSVGGEFRYVPTALPPGAIVDGVAYDLVLPDETVEDVIALAVLPDMQFPDAVTNDEGEPFYTVGQDFTLSWTTDATAPADVVIVEVGELDPASESPDLRNVRYCASLDDGTLTIPGSETVGFGGIVRVTANFFRAGGGESMDGYIVAASTRSASGEFTPTD